MYKKEIIKENIQLGNKLLNKGQTIYLLIEDLNDIYNKYYKIQNMGKTEFNEIIRLDPTFKSESNTLGRYGKWLLATFKRVSLKHSIQKWLDEDAYKITEWLTTYDLLKQKNILPDEYKDITKIGSFHALATVVENYESQLPEEEITIAEKDATKVYQDDDYLVIIPHTEEASCKYGANTRWCTASRTHNYFESYNNQGPLYIIIERKAPDIKYQFHFESVSFMDDRDEPIDIVNFFSSREGISEFFTPIMISVLEKKENSSEAEFKSIKKDGKKIGVQLEVPIEKMGEFFVEGRGRDSLSQSWINDYLSGNRDMYQDYSISIDDIKTQMDEISDENIEKIKRVYPDWDEMDRQNKIDILSDECNIESAISDGLYIGAESELHNDLIKAIESVGWSYNKGICTFHATNAPLIASFFVREQDEGIGYLRDQELLYFTLEEPRYGWQGFDEEAFNDRLSELIDENLRTEKEKAFKRTFDETGDLFPEG